MIDFEEMRRKLSYTSEEYKIYKKVEKSFYLDDLDTVMQANGKDPYDLTQDQIS